MKRIVSALLPTVCLMLILITTTAYAIGEPSVALQPGISEVDCWEKEFLADAEVRKKNILSNNESLPCASTAYYISNEGNDKNDGKSPRTAWASISKINTHNFKAGDVIYLERGGLWRGEPIVLKNGVSLSAYGKGEKPKIYGSTENGAVSKNWSLFYKDDTGKKIWTYKKKLTECGGIMLGGTDTIARRIFSWYDGKKFYDVLDRSKPFDIKDALDQDLTFYCDSKPKQTKLPIPTGPPILAEFTVYLRCDKGNPGEIYDSIEFINQAASDQWDASINASENCTIDNLCIMFCCTGVEILTDDVTIQNCEIAYAGGFPIEYIESRSDACIWAQGEGIFFAGGNVAIKNNYIHDIYGWGINFEVCRSYEETAPHLPFSNNEISGNLINNCSGPISICMNLEETRNKKVFEDLKIQDNWLMNAGSGWWYDESLSQIQPEIKEKLYYTSLLIGGFGDNGENTIQVSDNIFYRGKIYLVRTNSDNHFPVFKNNIFAQSAGSKAVWKLDEEVTVTTDKITEQEISKKYGDGAGRVIVLQPQ